MKKKAKKLLAIAFILGGFAVLYVINTPVANATMKESECPNGCTAQCDEGCWCYTWHPNVHEYQW